MNAKPAAAKPRRLTVKLTGARADLPACVEVSGIVRAGELVGVKGAQPVGALRLVLRPHAAEGLALVAKGAEAWAWEPGSGADVPAELAPVVGAKFWDAKLDELRRGGRGLNRAVLGGAWEGSAWLDAGRIVVQLRREWPNHGDLTVTSERGAWRWVHRRAAVGADQTSTAPTLAQACSAGGIAALGFELRSTCSTKAAPVAKAPKASPPPAPPAPKVSKTPKASPPPAPPPAPKSSKAPKASATSADQATTQPRARAAKTTKTDATKAKAKAKADPAPGSTTPAEVRPLYDAQGRRWGARWRVVLAQRDGRGQLVPSNSPQTMRPAPAELYPPEFQARTLEAFAETSKIAAMVQAFEPDRVLVDHADATLGPPVVWPFNGRWVVLAGNGRTIAMLRLPPNAAQTLGREVRARFGRLIPPSNSGDRRMAAGSDQAWIVVRELVKPDGSPVSQAEAALFAAASQASTSAAESPLGRAVSLARGLGLASLDGLPSIRWNGAITAENLVDFLNANRPFVAAILLRMDPAQARRVQADAELLAEHVGAVLAYQLPEKIRREGFATEKEERALLAALPALVTLDQAIRRGEVRPGWGLLERLDAARAFAELVRNQTEAQAITTVERAAQQEQLPGVRLVWDELPPLGVVLGLLLKKAGRARDPGIPVGAALGEYLSAAFGDVPGQGSFFGLAPPDPAATLARLVGVRLPARTRAA